MPTFSQPDIDKLKRLITDGIQVKQEEAMLREGLKDTVNAVAEELDLKPSILNKAIKVAFKAELHKHRY
jgi:hypothetical protein